MHRQCENKKKNCENTANELASAIDTRHKLAAVDESHGILDLYRNGDHPMGRILHCMIAEEFNKSVPD